MVTDNRCSQNQRSRTWGNKFVQMSWPTATVGKVQDEPLAGLAWHQNYSQVQSPQVQARVRDLAGPRVLEFYELL